MSEKIYDEEIAPLLKQVGDICKAHDLGLVAVVEYAPGSRGKTFYLPDGVSLSMVMVNHCEQTAPNVDAYVIGLKRYCSKNGIPTDSSFVMRSET